MTRHAVVTGGGSGIGRAIAVELADAGFDVVVAGRRPGPLKETCAVIGPAAKEVLIDITQPDSVADALPELPGQIDVLVNNAGAPPAGTAADLAGVKAEWLASLESNLLGAVLMTEALRPRFTADARIVNIGSIAAKSAPFGFGPYGPAKAALETWTGNLAFQIGRQGVTVNTVAPNAVERTATVECFLTAEQLASIERQTATRRLCTPEDVAAAVAFLASPAARQITGQVLYLGAGVVMAR
ncbi:MULTISPECIES: SDR family NAD(P)-dependent oxidoreductase [Amycolatopsis]|uniref:SDR family NAD(P)-dependent oxidoreductase n=1 Tax=Amycolatopsis albidoflavus TaxID=102226 RepID=A0ABW5I914_9PSEU